MLLAVSLQQRRALLGCWLLCLLTTVSAASSAGVITPWRCLYQGLPPSFANILVRLNGSNPECASVDGFRCLRNPGFPSSCLPWMGPKLDRLQLKPLQCGAAHAAAWPGNTGYNQAGHWCSPTKAALLAELQQTCEPGAAEVGQPCSDHACCRSGLCQQARAVAGTMQRLCGCKTSKDCGRVSFCEAAAGTCELKRYQAMRCSSNEQCLSGSCKAANCTCSTDEHCPPSQFCQAGPAGMAPSTSACRDLKVFGQQCLQDKECFTQRCLGGQCKDCTSNSDCGAAGSCNAKTFTCQGHEQYKRWRSCKADVDCIQHHSGKCRQGTCVVCTEDKHCASGPQYKVLWGCRRALNPLDNTCLPVKRCASDGACGVAPSADDPYTPGKCAGKTCLKCWAAGQTLTRHPAELDILSTGPMMLCNVLNYTWG